MLCFRLWVIIIIELCVFSGSVLCSCFGVV